MLSKKAADWGEHSLTAALYRAHSAEIFRYLRKLLPDDQAAEDGLQYIFLQVWRREGAGGLEAEAKAYLYTAAKNYARQCRRSAASRIIMSGEEGAEDHPDDAPSSEEAVHYQQLLAEAVHSVRELPEETQRIFMLYFGKGYTHSQIAKKLRITTRTVERHMAKALQCVRLALEGKYP